MTKSKASEDLYKLYHDKVFGYLLSRLGNRADAEDITSEVFLKLYSKSDDFDLERKGAASYIFKAMQSTLFDFYRKNNKTSFVPLDELRTGDESEEEDLDDTIELLDKALDTLSSRERDIIILHYYDGLGHKEISEKMGISYTNVRQISHVAIKKLREKLDFELGEGALNSVTGGLLSSYADVTIPYKDDPTTILIKKGGS